MATIKDVAEKAGISVTTVSRVLNGTAPVNEITKDKILKAMKELKYSPSIIAQGMRTKKSKTVGIVMPNYANPFYNELFKNIENQLKESGYRAIISSIGDEPQEEIGYISELIKRNIDGIIINTYSGDEETVEYLLSVSKKLPVIFLDNFQAEKSINSVYTNGYLGIKEITKHLIAEGHKKIAFIRPIKRYRVANDRYDGYIDALKEAQITVDEALVCEGDYCIESGFKAAEILLQNVEPRPTAIIAAADIMAVGAINFIKSIGLRVPEDVAVAGFDDVYLSRLITPPLTTYRQPIEELAEQIVDLLINKINHPSAKNKKIILKGEVVIRRSTDRNKPEIEKILK